MAGQLLPPLTREYLRSRRRQPADDDELLQTTATADHPRQSPRDPTHGQSRLRPWVALLFSISLYRTHAGSAALAGEGRVTCPGPHHDHRSIPVSRIDCDAREPPLPRHCLTIVR